MRLVRGNQRVSKHFIDTIKITAYRAETALVHILPEKIQLTTRTTREAWRVKSSRRRPNLIPDSQAKTLKVEIHGLTTPRDDLALEHLCPELTATETNYPGTNLRMKRLFPLLSSCPRQRVSE